MFGIPTPILLFTKDFIPRRKPIYLPPIIYNKKKKNVEEKIWRMMTPSSKIINLLPKDLIIELKFISN